MKLLKVVVQAVMVDEDEDGFLNERVAEPVTVPARDWRKFASEGGTFDQNLARLGGN